MNSDSTSINGFERLPCRNYVMLFILRIVLFLFELSDIILMINYKYFNPFYFIDDLVMLIIPILYFYSKLKKKNIKRNLVLISAITMFLSFIPRVFGLVSNSEKFNSKEIPDYYIIINSFIIFLEL